jgi:MarR family transcriptional regulator for hemolysin
MRKPSLSSHRKRPGRRDAGKPKVSKATPKVSTVTKAAKLLEAATMATVPLEAPGATLRSGFLIHDVSRLRRTAYDQRLKPFNITRAQWWVLANLSRRNCDGISQIELARLLDVGKVTLGGLIDRLEESGFVIRVPDKHDRRSKRVMRSPEGKALCDRMEIFAHAVNQEIMKGISEEEHRVFIDVLTEMKRNLINMDAVPQSTPRQREKASIEDESMAD